MPTTLKEVAVKANRNMTEIILATSKAMPADKLTWKPLETGRDALDILAEVVDANESIARVLQTGGPPVPSSPEEREKRRREIDTLDKAAERLRASSAALADAVRAFPENRMAEEVNLGRISMTFADLMTFATSHLAYHFGQINYIQTLYGDWDMHF